MNYFNEFQEMELKKSFDKTTVNAGGDVSSPNFGNSCCFQNEMPYGGMMSCPIYECPQERVKHRYICYEVPHIMPCNTRIINHHVFRHTYRPEYTCCEENVCENVVEPRCC